MDLPSQPEQTYFSDIPNSIAFSIADEKDEMASERFKTVINLAPEHSAPNNPDLGGRDFDFVGRIKNWGRSIDVKARGPADNVVIIDSFGRNSEAMARSSDVMARTSALANAAMLAASSLPLVVIGVAV